MEGLTKQFGSFVAVDHISFSVGRGEIFGFLGANGAGKTTAMRMLTGLSRPTDGRATVAGFDVAGFDVERQPEEVKRHIGYMSQKFSLYEDLKVWENIRLFAGIYGVKEADIAPRTDEVLRRIGLEAERNTRVGSLPLGWKQKLAFRRLFFWTNRRVGWTLPRASSFGSLSTKRPTVALRSSSPPTSWTRRSIATVFPSWWTGASVPLTHPTD